MKDTILNYYNAIDWSIENIIAIARMTKKSKRIILIDIPSDMTGTSQGAGN